MAKKALFVINTMGRAGAEKCLLSMFEYMKDEGYEISLFSVINMGELFLNVPPHVKILNENPSTESVVDKKAQRKLMKTILKDGFHKGYFFGYFGYFFKMLKHQLKIKKFDFKKLFWKLLSDHAPVFHEEYDLAVAYIQGAATYYVMDRVNAKKKVAFLHNEYEESGYCPALDYPYYEKVDWIYCVSQSIVDHFVETFPVCKGKTEVFYNILNQEEIKKKALETGDKPLFDRQENELILLTAARLSYVKAYDLAVPALAKVLEQGYSVKWYVLGDGVERENIEKLIEKYHLQDKFILLGVTDNPYPYIAQCDIYIQATRYEGCCTSISEAVILETPVIASDCDGNKEQLERYKTGEIVSLTVDSIAAGIIKVASSKELRQSMVESAEISSLNPYEAVKRLYRFME